MRDLYCSHCSKLLIENFWQMVEAETIPTFASVSLTCECGELVRVAPVRKPRWTKLGEIRLVYARA